MRGWVFDKLAGLGVFLVQSGRFLVVQKFIYLNLGSNISILAPCIWNWRYIFEFWHHTFEFWRCLFEFWRQNLKTEFFRRVWGGWVLQDLREVSSSVSGKNIPPTPCRNESENGKRWGVLLSDFFWRENPLTAEGFLLRSFTSGRQKWRFDKIGDSGVKRVILKYCRCTTYCSTLHRRER